MVPLTSNYGLDSAYTQVMTLGAVDTGVEKSLDPIVLGVIAVIGSAVGGAILGYFAEGSERGAMIGASLSGGLTGVADALLFMREQRQGSAIVVGAVGLGLIGLGLYQSPAIKFGRK